MAERLIRLGSTRQKEIRPGRPGNSPGIVRRQSRTCSIGLAQPRAALPLRRRRGPRRGGFRSATSEVLGGRLRRWTNGSPRAFLPTPQDRPRAIHEPVSHGQPSRLIERRLLGPFSAARKDRAAGGGMTDPVRRVARQLGLKHERLGPEPGRRRMQAPSVGNVGKIKPFCERPWFELPAQVGREIALGACHSACLFDPPGGWISPVSPSRAQFVPTLEFDHRLCISALRSELIRQAAVSLGKVGFEPHGLF